LSGGARYDLVHVPYRNTVGAIDDASNDFRALSPRAGVSVALGGGASIYASAGASFRAPAILELGCADPEAACPLPFALGDDPPLRPVRATTLELGGTWTWRFLVATASAYRTAVRDEILFVASDAARLAGYFTNLPRTRRTGIELSARATHGRWDSYASYAYTSATFRTSVALFSPRSDEEFADNPLFGANAVTAGDRLPLVPAHQMKGGASVALPRGVDLGVEGTYVGRQWLRGDEANETRPLDGYTVMGARLGYTLRAWRVHVVVSNALDARAAVFGAFNENRRSAMLERFLTPLAPRTVTVALERAFDLH
jgi:iron complex outermembrane receptor protein